MKGLDDTAAMYRIQLHKDFTFYDVISYIDYWKNLGITHLYLSPFFESVPGSNHGYDVLDPNLISLERGGEDGLVALDETLFSQGMGMVVDIVPNHMAAHGRNPYWRDVLKNGGASRYWHFFDLLVPKADKIDLPVLDAPLDELIKDGKIKFVKAADGWDVHSRDRIFPLCPETDIENPECLKDDAVRNILSAQHYRLVHWTSMREKMDYRRFFDIADLIGIKVDDPDVYQETHRKIIDLSKQLKSFTGVRVDHVDGLKNPREYLERLSKDIPNIWIEKILSGNEKLAADWPVLGTTGYEFIDRSSRLFVCKTGFKKIEKWWRVHIEKQWSDFQSCVQESKKDVIENLFSAELNRLSKGPHGRDYWRDLTADLDVYRTYADGKHISAADQERLEKLAYKTGCDFPPIEDLCLWQALSAPAMAKGLEDTAHYRYTPLAGLNEVGSGPDIFEGKDFDVIAWLSERHKTHPLAMKETSTHDTKRAEDARHRLYALSHYAQDWIDYAGKAFILNRPFNVSGISRRREYFFYQAIVATWPFDDRIDENFKTRLQDYMIKSVREAKEETNWLNPDVAYEDGLKNFIETVLSNQEFLSLTAQFMKDIARAGALISLSVLALKILSPGICSIYQGNEIWNFSLVDPDNRRKIDYVSCRKMLLDDLKLEWKNGSVKIRLTARLLRLRQKMGAIKSLKPLTQDLPEGYMGYRLVTENGEVIVNVPCQIKTLLAGYDGHSPDILECPVRVLWSARE